MDKISAGDVLQFFDTSHWFSKIIQWYNILYFGHRGPVHSAVIHTADRHKVIYTEAVADGVRNVTVPRDEFIQMINSDLYALMGPEKQIRKFRVQPSILLDSMNHTPYGFLQLLGIGTRFLFGWVPRIVKWFLGNKMMICSEVVVYFWWFNTGGKINLEEEYDLPRDFVTPMHIWLSKHFRVKKIE